jgi:cell division protein FtsQ
MSRPGRSQAAGAGIAVTPDRRFRRSEHRPAHRRATQFVVRAIVAAVTLMTVASAAVWAAHSIVDAPWLRVDRLVVTGTARLTAEDVERMVIGIRRESILRVDFAAYRRRVLESPWVADVTLWRRLPSTVEIRVRERAPMALARVGHQLYLTDATGIIIDEFGPEYADVHAPIVTGLISTGDSTARLVDRERVQLTSAFLATLSDWPALRDRVSEIDVSRQDDVVVLMEGETAWLHLGHERFLERLKTYVEVRPSLADQLGELDSVDLRFDGRLFVRPGTRADR